MQLGQNSHWLLATHAVGIEPIPVIDLKRVLSGTYRRIHTTDPNQMDTITTANHSTFPTGTALRLAQKLKKGWHRPTFCSRWIANYADLRRLKATPINPIPSSAKEAGSGADEADP